MEYEFYRSKTLAHSAKGKSWSDHKYISKFFKNGKWQYVYKQGNAGSKTGMGVGTGTLSNGYKWYQLPNGKKVYAKAGRDGYVDADNNSIEIKSGVSTSNVKTNKHDGYGTIKYDQTKDGKTTHYKETTIRGKSWLTKKSTQKLSDGTVSTTIKKGKIRQGIEDTAKKGKNFISNIGKKKKYKANKKTQNNRKARQNRSKNDNAVITKREIQEVNKSK